MTVDFFLASSKANSPVPGIKKNIVAMWRGNNSSDYTPAINPRGQLTKLRFHSELDYMRVAKVVTSRDAGRSPVTLAARGESYILAQNNTLFAHGMGFEPLMICDIEVNGYKYACNGSSMILPAGASHDPRWCGFTSDATNIYLNSRGWMGDSATIHWRVHVLDEQFQTESGFDDLLSFKPDELLAPKIGKIDSTHRFVRKSNAVDRFSFVGRQTMAFGIEGGRSTLQFSDGVTHTAAATVNVTPWPVGGGFVTYQTDCET